jgi:hypothetical protein
MKNIINVMKNNTYVMLINTLIMINIISYMLNSTNNVKFLLLLHVNVGFYIKAS